MRFNSFGLALLSLALASPAPAAGSRRVFSPESFRSHVAFLADDRLEGRDTGSRGYDLAALYVASRFEALGLKPAGRERLVPAGARSSNCASPASPARSPSAAAASFTARRSCSTPTPDEAPVAVEAPVVFVGYGLEAPEIGIDDYKGLDVRGKIVVVLERLSERDEERRRRPSQFRQKAGRVQTTARSALVSIRTLSEAKRRALRAGCARMPTSRAWAGSARTAGPTRRRRACASGRLSTRPPPKRCSPARRPRSTVCSPKRTARAAGRKASP